jgi:enamine deaminase RidA (YjgF/YER057c/UK114 family)
MIKQIRQNVSSESAFEPAYGFSRVVRVGNQIFVSGTTAIKADGTMEGARTHMARPWRPSERSKASCRRQAQGRQTL